jgi:hypothetical protein
MASSREDKIVPFKHVITMAWLQALLCSLANHTNLFSNRLHVVMGRMVCSKEAEHSLVDDYAERFTSNVIYLQ